MVRLVFPQRFPEGSFQRCSAERLPKLRLKVATRSCCPKLLPQCCQTGPKSCSPDLGHHTKLLPNVLSTDVAKKAAEPSKGSLQSFFSAALQRCVYMPKNKNTQPAPLHKKLLACARLLPQSCDFAPNTAPSQPFYFQNHFPQAASETCYQLLFKDVNCSKFNLSNIKTKTAPHSYAGQRLPKSCAPSTATPQSFFSSRKMSFSSAVPQSAFAKQRPQSGSTSNLFRPSYYPQWLPKTASQTCHDYRTSIQTWFVRQSCRSSKLLLPKDVPLCFSTNKCQMLFSKRP